MGKVRFASVAATAEAQNHHRYSEHGSWRSCKSVAQGTNELPEPLHSGAFLYGPCMPPPAPSATHASLPAHLLMGSLPRDDLLSLSPTITVPQLCPLHFTVCRVPQELGTGTQKTAQEPSLWSFQSHPWDELRR